MISAKQCICGWALRSFVFFPLLFACTSLTAQSHPPAPQSTPTISAAPKAQIIPPPPGYRFPNGEAFVYSVEWHLFTAGIATVRMEPAGLQQKVTATAESAGVANVLFKVHDQFQANFDARTFCSVDIFKHSEEGAHQRQTQIGFDYARRKSVLDEKNLKTGEQKHVENDIPGCVTDVVSGFYYLASLPLQIGASHLFTVSDGGKTTDVVARVEAREQVKVPAGTFQAVRVKAEAVTGSLKGRGTIWVWFSDDGNHAPVQMRSKLGWGTLLFRLQRLDKSPAAGK